MELNDLSRNQLEWLIDQYIHNARDRHICRLKHIDGLTYQEISDSVHVCTRQIGRIIFKSKQTMLSHVSDLPMDKAV